MKKVKLESGNIESNLIMFFVARFFAPKFGIPEDPVTERLLPIDTVYHIDQDPEYPTYPIG